MRYFWFSLMAMLTMTALVACQSAASASPFAPTGSSPGPSPQSSPPQDVAPTLAQEDSDMVPVTPPDETAEKMVSLVKGHLAQRLNIPAGQIVLTEVKPVVWRDAGLGCPKPGVDYIQMETQGYRISLEANGRAYIYQTDSAKRFVPCSQ